MRCQTFVGRLFTNAVIVVVALAIQHAIKHLSFGYHAIEKQLHGEGCFFSGGILIHTHFAHCRAFLIYRLIAWYHLAEGKLLAQFGYGPVADDGILVHHYDAIDDLLQIAYLMCIDNNRLLLRCAEIGRASCGERV